MAKVKEWEEKDDENLKVDAKTGADGLIGIPERNLWFDRAAAAAAAAPRPRDQLSP